MLSKWLVIVSIDPTKLVVDVVDVEVVGEPEPGCLMPRDWLVLMRSSYC